MPSDHKEVYKTANGGEVRVGMLWGSVKGGELRRMIRQSVRYLGRKREKASKHRLRTRDECCDNTCVAEGQACEELRRRHE